MRLGKSDTPRSVGELTGVVAGGGGGGGLTEVDWVKTLLNGCITARLGRI